MQNHIKVNNHLESISQSRLDNLTANIKEAWKSISSAIVNFSILLHEAYEGKVYKQRYKSWEEYVENELPVKRRQADYYRSVGEFYCKYENSINADRLDFFTQKDFLRLIKILNGKNEEQKKYLLKKIFNSNMPQLEIEKYKS